MVRSPGAFVRSSIGADVTIEQVRDKWSEVTDMSKAFRIETITEATTELISSLQVSVKVGAKFLPVPVDSPKMGYFPGPGMSSGGN